MRKFPVHLQLDKIKKIRKTPLFIILSSAIAIFLMLILFREIENPYEADRGVLDLQESNLSEGEIFGLSGQWAFYPNRFLDPVNHQTISRDNVFVKVPGNWNKIFNPQGFATYSLKILLPPESGELSLLMPNVSTAYTLYINGRKSSSNGNASTTGQLSEPAYKYKIVSIDEQDEEIELLVHISNFHYGKGGMWTAPIIGRDDKIQTFFQSRIFSETLIAGGFFLVGIILLTLFLVRKEFISYANLGLFCVIMGIRTLIAGEIPLTYFFPAFNWNYMVRGEYLTMSLGFIFMNSYFFNIYSRFYNKKVFSVFNILAGLYSMIIILTPVYFFTSLIVIFQILLVSAIFNVFSLFIRSGQQMKEENTILITGITLLLIMVILDIAIANNQLTFLPYKINSSYGLIILILSNSLLLIKQAARLTVRLREMTGNLEELVRTRTSELESANRKLSEQAVTDLLTGVNNRHEFANVMKLEEARFLRTGKCYAALYLDLDNFKYINDTFGHPAGDLILQKFATMLKSIIRDNDYLFRLGGDEFFILMSEIQSVKDAESLAVRILEQTERWEGFKADLEEFLDRSINVPANRSFSLSIGISSTDYLNIETIHTLPSMADKALLKAKADGKNRYAVYTIEDDNLI